jgi:hypothetical protein
MSTICVNGSINGAYGSSTAYTVSESATCNTLSFTAVFVNNSTTNTHFWEVILGGSIISSGSFRQGTISVPFSFSQPELSTNQITVKKYGPNDGLLGQGGFGFTMGYTYTAPPPTPAPSFTDTTVAGGILGKSYSDGVSASTTTSYAIASGSLPTGLSLNTSSGAITGTPTAQGSFTFAINASGGGGTTGSGNLTIQVLPAGNRRNDLGFDINLANAKR